MPGLIEYGKIKNKKLYLFKKKKNKQTNNYGNGKKKVDENEKIKYFYRKKRNYICCLSFELFRRKLSRDPPRRTTDTRMCAIEFFLFPITQKNSVYHRHKTSA